MTNLTDIFDLGLLQRMVDEKYVRVQTHPHQPLRIYNYTEQTQWDKAWNEVTRACRGLIATEDGEVLARPLAKFHNWDEPEVKTDWSGRVEYAPKMDGSCGILYPVDYDYAIATRGSFASEQAIEGTKMLRSTLSKINWLPTPGKTYIFEILYPENRIVVDYGSARELVLLDVLDIRTGRRDEHALESCPWPRRVVWQKADSFTQILEIPIKDDEEGFVCYWPHYEYRVKIKGETYKRLHRILTGLDNVRVWEHLRLGGSVDGLLDHTAVPDEFYAWLGDTAEELYASFEAVSQEIGKRYNYWASQPEVANKRDFALAIKGEKYRSALFNRWDGKDNTDLIWKIIKPVRRAPWQQDEGAI
jgi:RNA ligase